MSDLYLTLQSRLEAVKEWLYIGEETMRTARESLGLSRESVARQLHVSSKTYERHEKEGRVPRYRVNEYARVLELEITEPGKDSISLPEDDELDIEGRLILILAELRDQASEDQLHRKRLEARLRKLEAALQALQSPARSRRAQGGKG